MKISLFRSELKVTFPKKASLVGTDTNIIYRNFSKRLWFAILAALSFLSILAWIFYYKQGLTLAYNDARSHLNVARRVVDNLQPGLAQIGSVWLPLFHIFELPLIGNDFLWHSGIAGSIVSMIAFVLGGAFLIAICQYLKFNKTALIISLLIYVLNPNLLFLQTTPMTESLLIALSLGAVYFTLRWSKEQSIIYLVYAALFTFLTTLTRYDGWFLLLAIALFVGWVAIKKRDKIFAEGNLILYLTLGAFGVFLWIVWNALIFHDPLFFAIGPFSAKAQQDIVSRQGGLVTKGNPVYSFFLYLLAVFYNIGPALTILTVLGLWLFLSTKKYTNITKGAVILLLVPLFFNITSLIAGHSVIHLPQLPPYTWFNDRYGLMVLPAIAILVGFLANRGRLLALLIGLIIITQTAVSYGQNNIITIEDGVHGSSGEFLDTASIWMQSNIKEGLILVAASSNDALLFRSGLPLKRFITEGARLYWDESTLNDPTKYATWIIMHKGDLVYKNLINNKKFLGNFRLVYKDQFSYIYKLDPHRNKLLKQEELP